MAHPGRGATRSQSALPTVPGSEASRFVPCDTGEQGYESEQRALRSLSVEEKYLTQEMDVSSFTLDTGKWSTPGGKRGTKISYSPVVTQASFVSSQGTRAQYGLLFQGGIIKHHMQPM